MGLTEAVDFVEEQKGCAAAITHAGEGAVHRVTDILDARGYRRQFDTVPVRGRGDRVSEGGFTSSRGTPQDE